MAPFGTAAPTDTFGALNAAFAELGFLSDAGAVWREAQDVARVVRWNTPNISRGIPLKRSMTVTLVLREWNKRTVELALDGTVSTNSGEWKLVPSSLVEKAVVLEWVDGTNQFRLHIPKCYVSQTVDSTVSRRAAADLPVTFSIASDGASIYTLFTNDTSFSSTGVGGERSAVLSATANVAVTPQRLILRQAALSATADIASISQGGTNEFLRSAALSGTADIVASGSKVTAFARSAALDATADIPTVGIIRYYWSESDTETTQTGTGVISRAAALTGTADISVVPQAIILKQVDLSATADISVAGAIGANVVTGSADLSATINIAATAEIFGEPPVDEAQATTSITTVGTTHVVNLPTGIVLNSLVIIVARIPGPAVTTWPAGWTSYLNDGTRDWHDVDLDTADDRVTVLYRLCDGTEGSTISVGLDVAQKGAYVAYRISGHRNPVSQVPQILSAIGSSVNPDPPALAPTGGADDYLFLAIDTHQGEQTATVDPPSGYINFGHVTTGSTGTTVENCQINFSSRQRSNVTDDDPTAYTISNSAPWTALTIAIHPALTSGITVAVSGTADIASAPQRDSLRQVGLSATADVTAFGQIVTGGPIHSRQIALDATADIAAAPQRDLLRQVLISNTAADIISAGQTFILNRQVALDGTAAIASAGGRVVVGQALLSATASIATVALLQRTVTFFSAADGYLRSTGSTYAIARDGTGVIALSNTSTIAFAGQEGTIAIGLGVNELFVQFDTSTLPDNATVVDALLSLPGSDDLSDTDFSVEVYQRDWGSSLTTSDYIPGASISTLTRLATFATTAGWAVGETYNDFTSESVFPSVVDLDSSTRMVIVSDHTRLNIETSGNSVVGAFTEDNPTNKPKLAVTFTIGAPIVQGGPTTGRVCVRSTSTATVIAGAPAPTPLRPAQRKAKEPTRPGKASRIITPPPAPVGGGGAQGPGIWMWP